MVLSNAERQARYRKNLKARAQDPGAVVRAAVDATLLAVWNYHVRNGRLEEIDGKTFKHWVSNMRLKKNFGAITRLYLDHFGEALTPEERQALETVRDAADALDLLCVGVTVPEE